MVETHVIRSTGYFCNSKIKLFHSFTFEISWHLQLFYILVIQLVIKRHGFHKDAVIHISLCQMSTLKVKKRQSEYMPERLSFRAFIPFDTDYPYVHFTLILFNPKTSIL